MLILGEMKYPHTVFKYQPLPYPWISYVVYVIFCVCMPIIIKNLLVSKNCLDVLFKVKHAFAYLGVYEARR